jgi:hypothetical protein
MNGVQYDDFMKSLQEMKNDTENEIGGADGLGLHAAGAGILLAQSETPAATCDLKAEQAELADQLANFAADAEADPDAALAALYRVGAAYQELATRCGYSPSQEEREALADYVLTLVDIPTILIRNTVGTDVLAILAKLDGKRGDPINGQLLYNGLEMGVDGAALGCANCHTEEGSAPPTGDLDSRDWRAPERRRWQTTHSSVTSWKASSCPLPIPRRTTCQT